MAALTALSILLTPTASAQRSERVLLLRRGQSVDPELARSVGRALREGWRSRGARVEAPPSPEPARASEAPAQLEEAWAHYQALRLEEARERLLALADALGRAWGEGLDEAQQVDLWLLTSMTEAALGDDARSRDALARALIVRPDLEIDPTRYPPTLVERAAELRRDPPQRAALEVTVLPSSATLVVNGRTAGIGDRTLELPLGRHWVRAEASARASAGAEVELGAGGEQLRLTLPIDPAAALADLGPLGAPLPSAAREALSLLGQRASVLEITRRGGEYVFVLQDEASGRSATLRDPGADPARIAPRLLDALLAPEEGPLVWPWIAGAGGLLAAAAIVVGVVFASATDGWRATASR